MYEQVVVELYDHGHGGCGTLSSWYNVAVQFPSTGEKHPVESEQAPAQRMHLTHFFVDVPWKKPDGVLEGRFRQQWRLPDQ